MNKTKLPRTHDATPRHPFLLRIPDELRERMIKDACLSWGHMTPFILAAICEKLERETKGTQS